MLSESISNSSILYDELGKLINDSDNVNNNKDNSVAAFNSGKNQKKTSNAEVTNKGFPQNSQEYESPVVNIGEDITEEIKNQRRNLKGRKARPAQMKITLDDLPPITLSTKTLSPNKLDNTKEAEQDSKKDDDVEVIDNNCRPESTPRTGNIIEKKDSLEESLGKYLTSSLDSFKKEFIEFLEQILVDYDKTSEIIEQFINGLVYDLKNEITLNIGSSFPLSVPLPIDLPATHKTKCYYSNFKGILSEISARKSTIKRQMKHNVNDLKREAHDRNDSVREYMQKKCEIRKKTRVVSKNMLQTEIHHKDIERQLEYVHNKQNELLSKHNAQNTFSQSLLHDECKPIMLEEDISSMIDELRTYLSEFSYSPLGLETSINEELSDIQKRRVSINDNLRSFYDLYAKKASSNWNPFLQISSIMNSRTLRSKSLTRTRQTNNDTDENFSITRQLSVFLANCLVEFLCFALYQSLSYRIILY